MGRIKKVAVSTKEFVVHNKTLIAVTGIVVLHVAVCHKYNNFLKEHGLYEEFFHLEEQ